MSFSVVANHLLVVCGFVLALVILGRLLREHRPPGNALAWILAILLIPYIGVPLYLIFGGRKLRRLASLKESLQEPRLTPPTLVTTTNAEKLLVATGCPPGRAGNRVSLLATGEEAANGLAELIDSAQHSIYLETFILSRDRVGRALLEKLCAKAQQGVKVYLLLDAWGSLFSYGRFVRPLKKAGGKVGVFLPMLPVRKIWSANLRNHRKIWIADEKRAIIGGRNIGKEYMGFTPSESRWLDFNVAIEGPAVNDLCRIFTSDWNFATGQTLTAEVRQPAAAPLPPQAGLIQIIPSGPDTPANRLYEGVLTATVDAKRRIWFVTPYFVPDETLVQSLSLMARLGRDIRVIVPWCSNHLLADWARGSYLRELIKSGVRCYGLKNKMIHTKITLIDDNIAVVGSANLDMRSLLLNYEVAAFCYSPHEIQQIGRHVLELLAQCEPLEWKTEGFRARMRFWFEDIGRLLAPLL